MVKATIAPDVLERLKIAFIDRNSKRTEGRKELLHYVFTTAIEGGIGHWSLVEEYHWGKTITDSDGRNPETVPDFDNFYARILNVEDSWGVDYAYQPNTFTKDVESGMRKGIVRIVPDDQLTVDIDVIERGCNLFVDKVIAATKSEDKSAPFSNKYWRQFVVQWLTDLADGDSDTTACDAIVQLGLFGEIVYA